MDIQASHLIRMTLGGNLEADPETDAGILTQNASS